MNLNSPSKKILIIFSCIICFILSYHYFYLQGAFPSIVIITNQNGSTYITEGDDLVVHISGGDLGAYIFKWFRNNLPIKEETKGVLSNETMKTFTGAIVAEHTPRSSHTDHTIHGYKFTVRVYTESGKELIATKCLVANIDFLW